jgi:hypothetical protein
VSVEFRTARTQPPGDATVGNPSGRARVIAAAPPTAGAFGAVRFTSNSGEVMSERNVRTPVLLGAPDEVWGSTVISVPDTCAETWRHERNDNAKSENRMKFFM